MKIILGVKKEGNEGHAMRGWKDVRLNVKLNLRHKELPLCSGVSFQQL
jgi:hypothetical protein